MHVPNRICLLCATASLWACAGAPPRFPLRAPLWQDSDLHSVTVRCRSVPSKKDPGHVSCAPEPYQSPIIWDGVDNLVFRPLSDLLALPPVTESVNVNSLDEVPDSSWFTNRIGRRPMSDQELELGGCDRSLLLDPEGAAEGTWVIDKGKMGGSTPGFRVNVAGKKYLLKADDSDQPERASAAATIGVGVYHAAGYNTSCEQIVYFKPSLLKLSAGLRYKRNFGDEKDFDRAALEEVLAQCPKRDGRVRMQASAWLPGYTIGSFRYEGTRSDDPNDVIVHENRRELRGARLLAAWIDRTDAREGNTLDSWFADRRGDPEASPGRVVHYVLDTSEILGPAWDWDMITRRMGYSYVFDWGDFATDFVTLGVPIRTWDVARTTPGHAMFSYFNVKDFVPDHWKMEYPNAAFSRMTERDGAWMARILARFTPERVRLLAEMGRFTDPDNTAYIRSVLEGRLERILDRYLTRLSPISDVRVEGQSTLCGVDLAEWRGVRDATRFRYAAAASPSLPLLVERRADGQVCVTLSHVAPDDGPAADSPVRYVVVTIRDGVAQGPLLAHLYDLGPSNGYRLVGVERPER